MSAHEEGETTADRAPKRARAEKEGETLFLDPDARTYASDDDLVSSITEDEWTLDMLKEYTDRSDVGDHMKDVAVHTFCANRLRIKDACRNTGTIMAFTELMMDACGKYMTALCLHDMGYYFKKAKLTILESHAYALAFPGLVLTDDESEAVARTCCTLAKETANKLGVESFSDDQMDIVKSIIVGLLSATAADK